MPQIRAYQQQLQSDARQPLQQAQASDFSGPGLERVGQGAVSAGQDLAYAQRIAQANSSRQAVTDVHTFLINAHSQYIQKAEEFENSSDAGEQNLLQKFSYGRDGSEDEPQEGSLKWYLDSYQEQIQDPDARRTFDQGRAGMEQQFTQHFIGVQSRMAGVYATQQFEKQLDGATTAAQTNPYRFNEIMANVNTSINDPQSIFGYQNITPDIREKFKRIASEQVSKGAMQGTINQNPVLALEQLRTGKYPGQLSGPDREALTTHAESAVLGQEAQARQVLAREAKAQKDAIQALAGKFSFEIGAHYNSPPGKPAPPLPDLSSPEAMKLAIGDDGAYRAVVGMANTFANHALAGQKKAEGGKTYQKFHNQIHLPYGDKNKLTDLTPIFQAAGRGELSPAEETRLEKQFTNAGTEEGQRLGERKSVFINSFKSSVTKSNLLLGKLDTEGDINYGKWTMFVDDQIDEARKENRSPYDLFKPDSPHYLGKQVGMFQKSMQESMRDISSKLRKAPTQTDPATGGTSSSKQRLPGETPEQYLKRMK